MSNIKIYISCHKESQLPANPLFAPIHVGAKNAAVPLEGLLRDDAGDNISGKNPYYCELTAQYWAWKNDRDSDYIGLCHYRRFLCFADVSASGVRRNERGFIVANELDRHAIRQFGLEDEAAMRAVIQASDAVVGLEQDVRKLSTPRGIRRTAYGHWAAHDGTMIFKKDLDAMLGILCAEFPELGRVARRYLRSHYFLGFNLFVLRRDLFDELCAIEFSVLQKLEQRTDISGYSQTQSRVFGFMGEIIFSAYIRYLETKRHLVVRHVPVLYFEHTQPMPELSPPDDGRSVTAMLVCHGKKDFLFAPMLRSFISHAGHDRQYNVIILSAPFSEPMRAEVTDMLRDHTNVSVQYADVGVLAGRAQERYATTDVLSAVPFLFPAVRRALVFCGTMLFLDSVVPLWEQHIPSGKVAACPADVRAMAACPAGQRGFKPCTSVMLWDFERHRSIAGTGMLNPGGKAKTGRAWGDALRATLGQHAVPAGQRWAVRAASCAAEERRLKGIPVRSFLEHEQARKTPAVVLYDDDALTRSYDIPFVSAYWKVARKSGLYEVLLAYYSAQGTLAPQPLAKRVLRSLKANGIRQTLRKAMRRLFHR